MYKVFKYMTLNKFDKLFLSFSMIISYFIVTFGICSITYLFTKDYSEASVAFEIGNAFIPVVGFIVLVIESIIFIKETASDKMNLYLMTSVSRVKVYLAHYISFCITMLILVGNLVALYLMFIYLIPTYNLGDIIAEYKYFSYLNDAAVFSKVFIYIYMYLLFIFVSTFVIQLLKATSLDKSIKFICITLVIFGFVILFRYNYPFEDGFYAYVLNVFILVVYFMLGLLFFKKGIK